MADSVYISSNLTSIQLEFMKLLDEYEIDIFRFEEIEAKLDRRLGNTNEILENLVPRESYQELNAVNSVRPIFGMKMLLDHLWLIMAPLYTGQH